MGHIISWISNWLSSHCNGDWEHEYGMKIETLDNPGWSVIIDLAFTELDHLDFETDMVETDDADWYVYKVRDKQYVAAGDLTKLELLLEKFKELVESNQKVD
ncbi:hypothetical protein CK934_02175 [Chitinophaga sp. MD30]|nr:hypothetical protein CK934_02175 [Chitinophaga sp. MD30]